MIVDAARWAPSGGNIQPWRFEADAHEIRMYLVPERTTTMDVRHRGSYVAIGAALFNARVAAASLKNLGDCQALPRGVAVAPRRHAEVGDATDYEIAPLASRVRTRVANRQSGTGRAPGRAGHRRSSRRGVEREGAQLRLATDRERIETMAELLAESDRIRFLLPRCTARWWGELRFPGRDSLDEGIDVRTLELCPPELAPSTCCAAPTSWQHLADWRAGQMLGARTRARSSPARRWPRSAVPRADPAWYVRGGAAVERLWLTLSSTASPSTRVPRLPLRH